MPALRPAHVDLWSDRALVVAQLGRVSRHAHAATALLVGLDGEFGIQLHASAHWHVTRTAWLPAGVSHELDCGRTLMATLYLFPLTVAARDVLGHRVRQQHVHRATGSIRNAVGHPRVVGRMQVRPSDANVLRTREAVREVMEPLRVGIRVVVDIRDDLTRGRVQAGVTSAAEPLVRGSDQTHTRLGRNQRGVVRRAVIDENDLVVRVLQPSEACQAGAQRSRAVERADDYADPGPFLFDREGDVTIGATHGFERGLGTPLPGRETELPVVHVLSATKPLVGPGEDERSRAPGAKRRPDLPVEHFRLGVLAIA
jgi:hypothetical protein